MNARRGVSAEARINYVWSALSGLTILAWGLAHVHRSERITPSGLEALAVLAIAGVKARLIIRHYMEVRTAPAWLRRTFDVWLAVLLVTIAIMYAYA